jgi:phosphopantothenoylcysteine decarboxylase/phosphopantothenate--cysteine ligase
LAQEYNKKKVLVGITGGIAAYKATELVRLLKKSGADVKVVMSKSALEFIQPLTLETVSNNPVYTDLFKAKDTPCCEHIELAKWPDMIVIAPATANIITKLAIGLSDDLLTTICLASDKPLFIAPAMNKIMWEKKCTQKNLTTLQQRNVTIIGPGQGEQACGDTGLGRMLEPEAIFKEMLPLKLFSPLTGKKILITAGPTIEPIDPVRFIGNHSSGKMGFAIAQAAHNQGAIVTLVTGPTHMPYPTGDLNIILIKTATEMHAAVMNQINNQNIFIAAAAVADYRVENNSSTKIKKEDQSTITLKLIRNPDILFDVAALDNPPTTIGFAAETDLVLENAKSKLARKNIDMIAANLVDNDHGFYKDTNALTIITKNGDTTELDLKDKKELAYELLQCVTNYRLRANSMPSPTVKTEKSIRSS